jgi:hypothetical protein
VGGVLVLSVGGGAKGLIVGGPEPRFRGGFDGVEGGEEVVGHQDYVSYLVGTCASVSKCEQTEKARKINSSARQVPISKKL